MVDTITPNLGLTKPEVGASRDAWGAKLNGNWDIVDGLLNSPNFVGDPKAPTPATADNDTSIATTAFVKAQNYVSQAFAGATYAPISSPVLSGNPTAPTPSAGNNSLSIATTAFVTSAVGAEATARTNADALKEDKSNKGVANGYVPLDSSTKIASTYLPAYVDDVEEYSTLSAFPATGTVGIIYVALDTNNTYRWSGSTYIQLSSSPGSSDAVPEGSVNLYYTAARSVLKADLVSPIFTGDPRAPTPSTSDNDTSIATTAYVKSNLANYILASSYTAADVLAKLLTVDGTGSGIDADLLDGQSIAFFATQSSQSAQDVQINLKAPLADPTFTGTVIVPTYSPLTASGSVASTAFVANAISTFQTNANIAYVNTSGDTMTGKLITAAPAIGSAGLNLAPGTAPTSPVDGDIWVTTGGTFAVRLSGSTYTPAHTNYVNNFTVKQNFKSGDASSASINIPHGVVPASPVNGDLWTTTTSAYARINGVTVDLGSAGTTISDTPPSSPVVGQLWWESDSGNLYIWYNDGTSTQWVHVNGAVVTGGGGGVSSVSGTAPVVSSGGSAPVISMPAANISTSGYLTLTDWATFNSKLSDAPNDGLQYVRQSGAWNSFIDAETLDGLDRAFYQSRGNHTGQQAQSTIINLTSDLALKAPLADPTFTGTPAAPTPDTSSNSTRIATTAYVRSMNYAPLASPALTGTPTAPTAGVGTNTTQIATTAFVTAAVAVGGGGGGAPLDSPTFTGDPKAPTPATADNDTSIATTAFVKAQGYLLSSSYTAADVLAKLLTVDGATSGLDADLFDGQDGAYYLNRANHTGSQAQGTITNLTSDLALKANLADPTFTGTPACPTAAVGSNSTHIATTAFVKSQGYSTLASPTFTGTPAAPTATAGTNTTQIATTAFVTGALGSYLLSASYTAADVLAKLLTVDGAGTGLDADLLDAQSGTYYLARGNHSGTQTLATISDAGTAASKNIHISTTAPGSPAVNDLWVDIT